MTPLRRVAVLLACLWLTGAAAGQSPLAGPFADDKRVARVAERYKAMLASNPAEGIALDRLWKAYEEHNATALLIDEYRQAAATDKPAAVLIYGHLLKRAGRLDAAAAAYDHAARLDPANPLPLIAEADLATLRSKPADAATLLEHALAAVPATDHRRADLLSKLGDAWLAAGQPLKASDAWEQLIAADPSNLALRKQLAANYENNGLPERAVAHYVYIEQHADPPGRAAALRELGRLHEARGEFDAARDALERGLALTARDNWLAADLQSRLIRLYQRAGKASELEARWRVAVEQAPRDLGGYLRLVALAEAQGDPAAARSWLEKAVALAPRDRENTLKLARLLADAGEGERAAVLYDGLLKLQPGNLDIILARAELDVQTGRTADAVARIEARLAQNPADESVAVPALQFFLSHRLDAAAEKCLRDAASRQPAATEPTLALAKFYFGRRRADDARAVLEALVHQPGDAPSRAQRWTAAADCYKEAGQTAAALGCLEEAVALQPNSGTLLVSAGELRAAGGDLTGGIECLERALVVAPDGPAREEIDHKLFQLMQDHSAAQSIPGGPVIRWEEDAIPGLPSVAEPARRASAGRRDNGQGSRDGGASLTRYLAKLEKTARETPTPAAYLRLARWQQWAHRPQEAAGSAETALQLDPASVPAREILADAASGQRDHAAIIRRLREIATLDPSRKAEASKRIADLLAEDGDSDAAILLLDSLVQDAPGAVEPLTDLALAQQHADRWFDALATWERAYVLPRLSPAQRANLRRPMVAAYEHLGEFGRAAELLQAAIDAQDDLAARLDLFRELAAFCQVHSLGAWLEGLYKDRLAAHPQNYFAMTAMAELQQTAGNVREAYRLLGQAYYSAPEPVAALRALVAQAEALGEDDEAVAHQQRLVALAGQANVENLEKLAALQDAAANDEAAVRTWEQMAARFPRDTAALGAAADYFAKARDENRARGLLRQIIALDPNDYRRTIQLAQLDARAGDPVAARKSLEAILASSQPEKPGDVLLLPSEIDPSVDPSEFAVSAGKSAGRRRPGVTMAPVEETSIPETDERGIRLRAIGELSRLLFAAGAHGGEQDRQRWLQRWHDAAGAGARSEPLAAFFHAGQKDAVADLTGSWLKSSDTDDADRLEKTFLLAGLRMENYAPLARWVWSEADDENDERPTQLIDTLQYFFSTGGQPSAGLVAQLFPAELKSRPLLWQVASSVFADKRWYAQAAELGERALALPGGNLAAESFQLAQWEVGLGRTDRAREVLRRAVEAGGGTAFDGTVNNAVFADLRAYYFLLPAGERAAFASSYLQRMRARRDNTVHATLAAVLLDGLAGDEAGACRELDRVVAMRLLDGRANGGTADLRRWNYVSACGSQLQTWNLDRLAAYVWRRGLADVSTFDRQDPDVRGVLAEMRLRLLVVEVAAAADPQAAREVVTEFLRETPSTVTMASAATALMNVGQYQAVIQIYRRLCRDAPTEAEYPRSLLIAEQAAGDHAAAEDTLEAILNGGLPIGNPAARLEWVLRLAALRESTGDTEGACRLLLDARRTARRSVAVLIPLAQNLERRGRLDDAAAIWREAMQNDRSATARLSLADLEMRRKRPDAALTILAADEGSGGEQESAIFLRRVKYCAENGRVPDALDLARQRLRDGLFDALPEAAQILAAHGQRPAACELLTAAVRRAREPAIRFQQQETLVRISAADAGAGTAWRRELRRLDSIADLLPGLRDQYAVVEYEVTIRAGATQWLEAELKRRWDAGRGDIAAGGQLAYFYLQNKQIDGLRTTVAAVDARLNLPEQTLYALETALFDADHADLTLPIAERLCRRFPQNRTYSVLRARALWKSGRREQASAVLETLDAFSAFHDDFAGQASALFLEMGDRAAAISSLENAVARDPLAIRSVEFHARLAALYLTEKRPDDASRLFAAAYRNPGQTNMEPLVSYLDATGQLKINDSGEFPGGELPLNSVRRAQLLGAIYDRLQQTGRVKEGFRFVEAHPDLLAGMPALASTLRRDATAEEMPALIKLAEQAAAASNSPAPRLRRELAMLYVREAELVSGDAMNSLTKAYELDPDNFSVARPLATALREQGQDTRASTVLRPFLGADALPSERDAALQIVGAK